MKILLLFVSFICCFSYSQEVSPPVDNEQLLYLKVVKKVSNEDILQQIKTSGHKITLPEKELIATFGKDFAEAVLAIPMSKLTLAERIKVLEDQVCFLKEKNNSLEKQVQEANGMIKLTYITGDSSNYLITKTNGLLKSRNFKFQKIESKSFLKITYCDSFYAERGTVHWNIQLNSKTVFASVVAKVEHKTSTIVAYVDNIDDGEHTLSIFVENISSNDVYTGYDSNFTLAIEEIAAHKVEKKEIISE